MLCLTLFVIDFNSADAMALVARQKMLLARSTDSYDEQDHDRLSAADDGVPGIDISSFTPCTN